MELAKGDINNSNFAEKRFEMIWTWKHSDIDFYDPFYNFYMRSGYMNHLYTSINALHVPYMFPPPEVLL